MRTPLPPLQPPAETPPDPSLTLTKGDLAEHFRCSERQVDNLRSELPGEIRLGSSPRWIRSSIVEWLERLAEQAGPDSGKPSPTTISKTDSMCIEGDQFASQPRPSRPSQR